MGKTKVLDKVGLKESISGPNHVIETMGEKWGELNVGLKESISVPNHVIEMIGKKWGRLKFLIC